MNTSAQVANAQASMTVENVVGLDRDAAARQADEQSATERDAASAGAGESADQADATLDDVLPLQNDGAPIYVVMAISINIAADYQKDNSNVVETE